MNKKTRIFLFAIIIFSVSAALIIAALLFFSAGSGRRHVYHDYSAEQEPDSLNEDESSTFTQLLDSLDAANSVRAESLKGGKITISICGLDSRVGTNTKHADANHLINIWLDSAVIEIISIPRGTHSDVGYHDSTGLNYLANYRAARGRDDYLEEIKRISGVSKIDYYAEFGFSQAIGLLELLGYKGNAVQTLRVLRSRKSFTTGDYQRSYNQGQFIRQTILKNFKRLDGMFGELALRGAVMLVETDLSYSVLSDISKKLREKGFPRSDSDVFVRLAPKFNSRLSNFNFADERLLDSLYKTIARRTYDSSESDTKLYDSKSISERVAKKLFSAVKSASADTSKRPAAAVSRLKGIFEQRAWFQITDTVKRDSLRKSLCKILERSYTKIGNADEARKVKLYSEAEDMFFKRNK